MTGAKTSGRPSETKQLKTHGPQGPPKLPKGLGEFATRLWLDAVEALPHVLQPLDYGVLILCCEAFEMAMTLTGDDAKERQQRLAAMARFESLAGKLGLTPHSRRVIKPVDGDERNQDDEFHDWMSEGGLD